MANIPCRSPVSRKRASIETALGFAGLTLSHHEQEECNAGVHRAFNHGLNDYGVAPAYGPNGECEIKPGVALHGLKRIDYALPCKTKACDRNGCRRELERSLTRLNTDHFDLYQLHHLVKPEDVRKALGPGGAMDAILKAREKGKIRGIGSSARSSKAAMAALRGFSFDTLMAALAHGRGSGVGDWLGGVIGMAGSLTMTASLQPPDRP